MVEAARRAAGISVPTWIMARRQTAGRGRRGRTWEDGEGNLAATLVLPRPGTALEAAQRSFVASMALFEAVLPFVRAGSAGVDVSRVRLKWPNDVLVDGRKVAGILLEAHGAGPGHLAIGIGVNLSVAPRPDRLEPGALDAIALSELGPAPVPEAFLERLAIAFAQAEARFREAGFEPLRRGWLARAARLGEQITARTGAIERKGRFVDVDKEGQLVLETSDGLVAIPAADVHF